MKIDFRDENQTGIDLPKQEMLSLSNQIAKYMGLTGSLKRMDSLQVASHSKWMSRLEIIYAVCTNAIRLLDRLGVPELIPQGCAHYLNDDDHNEVIYRCKGSELGGRLQNAINEAVALKSALEEAQQTESNEYSLLLRALEEQSIEKEGKRIPKEKHEISSCSLQAPSDPDATFRRKAGEDYKGYVGNVVETVASDGLGMITDMDLQPNTYSDSQFVKDYIENHDENAEPETITLDGAYSGHENMELAAAKGITLVPTALTGQLPDSIMADFEFSADGTSITHCPMGHEPEKCIQITFFLTREELFGESNPEKIEIREAERCEFAV